MSAQIVFSLYKPHEGKDEELRALIAKHVPTLQRLELITDRPAMLMRSKNGTYIEIFEWVNEEAPTKAHNHPEVWAIWEPMGKVSELTTLESLEESKKQFPHFEPASLA